MCACVCWQGGGDYYFHSFQSITHLFLGTSSSFGGESDRTREVDERNVGGETKSTLKRREDGWLIFTPPKSPKIEKHGDMSAPHNRTADLLFVARHH